MAQLDPESQDEGEKDALTLLKRILKGQDDDGKIASQIEKHLETDGISLQMLSEFDDFSLKETIDSWKLNTFDKKPFIIRGILVRGIKKLKNTKNGQSSTPQPQAQTQSQARAQQPESKLQHVVTEKELEMMEKLEKFEKSVQEHQARWLRMIVNDKNNNKNNGDEDSKQTELKVENEYDNKENGVLNVELAQNKSRIKIEDAFDDLFKKLNARKDVLIANMTKNFDEYMSTQSKYTTKLESVLRIIDDTKNTYNENCDNHNQTKGAIMARSQMNCEMIEKMIETLNADDLQQQLKECMKELENIQTNIGKELDHIRQQLEIGPMSLKSFKKNATYFEFTWLGVNLSDATNPVIHTIAV